MYIIKSWWKQQKEKIWKSKKFIHKFSSKKRFWNGIYSWLRRADARGSADTNYCMWRISLLCGSGIVNDVTKVGHAQNIYYQRILLKCLIHTLTLRRNLISLAIFNTIFWKIGNGLLFWATLYIGLLLLSLVGLLCLYAKLQSTFLYRITFATSRITQCPWTWCVRRWPFWARSTSTSTRTRLKFWRASFRRSTSSPVGTKRRDTNSSTVK